MATLMLLHRERCKFVLFYFIRAFLYKARHSIQCTPLIVHRTSLHAHFHIFHRLIITLHNVDGSANFPEPRIQSCNIDSSADFPVSGYTCNADDSVNFSVPGYTCNVDSSVEFLVPGVQSCTVDSSVDFPVFQDTLAVLTAVFAIP